MLLFLTGLKTVLKGVTPCIEISTVIGCKMNCSYCPQKAHVQEYVSKSRAIRMSRLTFDTCLSKIPKNVQIIFAGMAEPWLNPEATGMLQRAVEEGYAVGVYTTTVGMTKADVDAVKGFRYLHFCLHLPDGDGNMKVNVTPEYLEVLAYANQQIPNTKMCIGRIHPAVEATVGFVPDSSGALISRAGNLKSLAIQPKKGALMCSSCGPKIDHNILLPNGEVLLCCMDYAQQHVLGNLLEDSYDDLFTGAEYQKIQAGMLDENSDILCRKCEIASPRNY